MVKIIDGEIVQDDDPRAIEWERRQRQSQGYNDPRLRNNQYWQQQQQGPQEQQGSMGAFGGQFGRGMGRAGAPGTNQQGHGQSPFDGINQRLSEFGFRPWNIGGNVVEPIVTVALILALMFYGFRGVIVVAIVWYLFGRSRQA